MSSFRHELLQWFIQVLVQELPGAIKKVLVHRIVDMEVMRPQAVVENPHDPLMTVINGLFGEQESCPIGRRDSLGLFELIRDVLENFVVEETFDVMVIDDLELSEFVEMGFVFDSWKDLLIWEKIKENKEVLQC